MISHFWNLCRACPALDVDKLHSEYRSTYRWHEYTPKQQQVVRKPPLPVNGSGIDSAEFSRKKKHPELAYKSHDLFDPAAVAHETRASRADRESSAMQRRSQSEGPVKRNPLFQSEYRLQFASSKKGRERSTDKDEIRPQEPRPQTSYPPPAPSSSWNRRQTSMRSRESREDTEAREPKKSISMGQIQPTGNQPNSGQILSTGGQPTSGQNPQGGSKPSQDMNGSADVVDGPGESSTPATSSPARRKEYKSEYKNKFRPFSQYEYVGEGKFFNTSNSPPSEVDGPSSLVRTERQEKLEGEPWYKEVQELRKMANDYKCRGWGTDLVPPHMSMIYNQQLNLHEQAAKRESLSALALAISTPRSMNKDEKNRENQRKVSPAPIRLARPKTAPPKTKRASSRPESAQASPIQRPEKENQAPGRVSSVDSHSRGPAKESHGTPQGIRKTHDLSKPAKRRRPTTLDTSKHTTSSRPKDEDKQAKETNNKQKKKEQKQVFPEKTLKLEKPIKQDKPVERKVEPVEKSEPMKKGVSHASSKATSRDTSRPPSAIENHMDYFREPVVKSPPEPTRVKSPEQLLMRSPDPINWTVPLDTGKTFSVTQSVRDSDSARNSPMSDHSSHFDSVSGTAINLGLHSVNEKGSLHYPKVSALAREAKELQGKTNHHKEEPINEGKLSVSQGTPAPETTKLNGAHEPSKEEPDVNVSTVPQKSNLKCLEDPNFSFDEPAKVSNSAPLPPAPGKAEPEKGVAPPPTIVAPPTTTTTAAAPDNKVSIPAEKQPAEVLAEPATTAAKSSKPAQEPAATTAAAAAVATAPVSTPAKSSIPVPITSSNTAPAASSTQAAPSSKPAPAAGTAPATAASSSPAASHPSSIPVPTQPKKPSYRVLEDPDLELTKPMGTPYKVLEDPGMMTASIYEPSRDGKGGTGKI